MKAVGRAMSMLLGAGALGVALVVVYLIITGFPPEFAGYTFRLKNIRKPFLLLLTLLLASWAMHPDRKEKFRAAAGKIQGFVSRPYAIWALFGLYGLLFLWQQLTEFFALEINFIPFEFYDYMLYYFFQGKINFTGLLHDYYHVNNLLYLLAPAWALLKSPMLLVAVYGFLAAAAAVPLFGIARERFHEPLAPFTIAFVYLNYRYLQNVMLVNFSIEIFYPLLIFTAVYCALRGRWKGYYLAVLAGLLVKEDSFLYFSAVGLLVFFVPVKHAVRLPEKGKTLPEPVGYPNPRIPSRRLHGAATVLLSLLYFAFLVKIFIPWTGNTILEGDIQNFDKYGTTMTEVVTHLARDPAQFGEIFFGSEEKLRSLRKLVDRLLFLPLFSPAAALIAVPVLPLYLHQTGRDADFVEFRFHYAAAVIPFVFLALTFGFSNLYRRVPEKAKQLFLWVCCAALVFANGGHLTTRRINPSHLESIQWARRVPETANLVTHGHLLPYVGYRRYNYYFAVPFGRHEHPARPAYERADYYLIDLNVNPYPMERSWLVGKVKELEKNPDYALLGWQGDRYLFKRKDSRIAAKEA
ncbi:MAG: DUF2079 domain-containing protein [Candidatus Omnitrophica bacterium]|nr:DUF2079 domain-containing protein [Candidatus Omnitrophota bacterium]